MLIIGRERSIIAPTLPIKLHPEVLVTAYERTFGTLRHNRSHVPPIELCSEVGEKLVKGSVLGHISVATDLKDLWHTLL